MRTALLDVYRGAARNLVKERAALDGQTLHSTGAVLRTGSGDDNAARTWHGATVYVSGSVRAHWTLVFDGDEGLRAVVAGKTLARLRTGPRHGPMAQRNVTRLLRPVRDKMRPGAAPAAARGTGLSRNGTGYRPSRSALAQ